MQRLHFTCNRKICSHQHMNSMLQNFQGTGHYQCILIYKYIYIYSGTSIYRSRNDRFPTCTVCHFWSRMKFHINNVIYSRIHRSPNYRFTALIVCKSQSQHNISRIDRLKKKLRWSIYYLRYLLFGLQIWQHSNAVTPHTLPSVPRLRYQHQFGIILRCKWFCAFSCDS